ncbi:hypothetical protein METP3_02248 [Methanosarcinales archaeon]|nr:hypothetical protein METP3_02248 [Methanosarcinales archaeon]
MVKIILQPTGKDTITDARDIMGNLDLAKYKQFFDKSEYIELSKIYKDGKASCWSIKPGERKADKWERIVPGDVVLFSQKGIVASATITFKLHNATLGSEFMGSDEDGEIYNYFYFFDNVKNQNISIKDFNNAAGYSSGNIIRGFEVLSEDVSKNILSRLPEIESKHSSDSSSKYKQLLFTKCQIILYGPPGTGKTYNARKFAVEFISEVT